MIRLSIDISDELHYYLKIHTAHKKETIRDFVVGAIYSKVEQEKVPNEETVKVLDEAGKGIGINEYSSFDEMIQKIKKDLYVSLKN